MACRFPLLFILESIFVERWLLRFCLLHKLGAFIACSCAIYIHRRDKSHAAAAEI